MEIFCIARKIYATQRKHTKVQVIPSAAKKPTTTNAWPTDELWLLTACCRTRWFSRSSRCLHSPQHIIAKWTPMHKFKWNIQTPKDLNSTHTIHTCEFMRLLFFLMIIIAIIWARNVKRPRQRLVGGEGLGWGKWSIEWARNAKKSRTEIIHRA